MKVLVMPVHRDGASYYRITQPYTELNAQGLCQVVAPKHSELEDESFWKEVQECDVVVIRLSHVDFVQQWLDKYIPNKKVVLDLDDSPWDISPYADIYAYHGLQEVRHDDKWLWKDGEGDFNIRRNKRCLKRKEDLFRRVDLITVSTPRLRELMLPFNPNVRVVYNALNFDEWKPAPLKKDEFFRIGWHGGSTHYPDLFEIGPDLEAIMMDYPNVKLVFAGATFRGLTKHMDQSRVEWLPWIDCVAHPFRTALMNLDLAVIPLTDSPFNKMKSCVKWYEFSALKVPTIAVNLPPYSDEMPKESLTKDFHKTIAYLIDNKVERELMAEDAYKWVRDNRDITREVAKLYEALHLATPG